MKQPCDAAVMLPRSGLPMLQAMIRSILSVEIAWEFLGDEVVRLGEENLFSLAYNSGIGRCHHVGYSASDVWYYEKVILMTFQAMSL
jgi:hypothetical protein